MSDSNKCNCGQDSCSICGGVNIPVGPEGAKGEKGDQGPAGVDGQHGNKIYKKSGHPSNHSLDPNEGDIYINEDNGDLYQYENGSWVYNMNIVGSDGADGSDGTDGADGSQIITGSGSPSSSLGENGDFYVDTDTSDYYKKQSGSWVQKGNLQGQDGQDGSDGAEGEVGMGYAAISSDTRNVGDGGVITVESADPNLSGSRTNQRLAFRSGQRVRIAATTDPANNYEEAVIASYDDGTGDMSLNTPDVVEGSGQYSSWQVGITGEVGSSDFSSNWQQFSVGATIGSGSSGEVRVFIPSYVTSDSISGVSISSQSIYYKQLQDNLIMSVDVDVSVTRDDSNGDILFPAFEIDLPVSKTAQFSAGSSIEAVLLSTDGNDTYVDHPDTYYEDRDGVDNTVHPEWSINAGNGFMSIVPLGTPSRAAVTTYTFRLRFQLMLGLQ